MRAALMIAFMIPSLPVCITRPFYGIVLWTIIAFTSLQWYTYSTMLPWALLVAIPTLLGSVLVAKGWRNVFTFEIVLLVILWIWFTFTSAIATSVPTFSEHIDDMWDRWTFVSKVILMTVVTVAVVDTFARLRTLVIVIATCFGYFILKALPFLLLTSGADRVYGPERSMIADNNDFGLALNMTLPLYFFLAQTETRRWLKCVFWVLFLATIPAIFFTYSRGALVGLVAVIGMMFLQLKQRKFLVPVFIVGGILALVFAPDSWKKRMDPTNENAMDGSAFSRINAWTFCWNLAKDYPLTGGGFQTFTKDLFVIYASNPKDVHGPHSVYFGVLAEHGFVGLALYLSLIIACFCSTYWVVKWGKYHGDWTAVNYARMFQFALVGFLVSGCFLGRQYFDYYYTIIACIVVLRQVCKAAWNVEPVSEDLIEAEAEVAV